MLDLTIRDWMVIIGSLLIVAVIVDAWRRIRADRRDQVRLKIASVDSDGEEIDDIVTMRELPNGGARVLRREDLLAARREHDAAVAEEAQQNRLHPGDDEATSATDERPDASAQGGTDPDPEEAASRRPQPSAKPEAPQPPQPLDGVRPDRGEPANLDWLEDLPAESETPAEHEGGELPRGETEVFILHVVAADERGFDGKAILEILLACDLRFGDMDFFHRHEREAGRGPIQFSVANMLKPGVFDIDHMAEMRTRGLVFFLTLPGPQDMTLAFDYMLETARTVARNLGGQVLDETLSVLTEQSVEHARQQIRDLERRLLAQSP